MTVQVRFDKRVFDLTAVLRPFWLLVNRLPCREPRAAVRAMRFARDFATTHSKRLGNDIPSYKIRPVPRCERLVSNASHRVVNRSNYVSAFLAISIDRPFANQLAAMEDQTGRTSRLDRIAMVAHVILQRDAKVAHVRRE